MTVMLTRVLPKTYGVMELFDAWVSAAHDVQVAWERWSASPTEDRGEAYAGYCASLEREEHAAAVLAAAGSR